MNTTNVLTVGFCGYAGSGKDTAAGQLVREGWHRIAFGDKLKQHLLVIDPIVPLPPGFKPSHRHLSKVVATHGWDWAKREIAEVLGIGQSNVSTRINRIRQRLRDYAAARFQD